jgi:hypothetical protein
VGRDDDFKNGACGPELIRQSVPLRAWPLMLAGSLRKAGQALVDFPCHMADWLHQTVNVLWYPFWHFKREVPSRLPLHMEVTAAVSYPLQSAPKLLAC